MFQRPVIDGLEFARAGSRLEGVWPLADFPRLRDLLREDGGSVAYALEGVTELQGRPALRLAMSGTLPLTCQRCLEKLDLPLRIEATLQLAATQAELDAEPFDGDAPEGIVAAKDMPVRDLIEDELVLAVPIAPRHEQCAARGATPPADRHSPFAGLRGLLDGVRH